MQYQWRKQFLCMPVTSEIILGIAFLWDTGARCSNPDISTVGLYLTFSLRCRVGQYMETISQ